MNTRVTVAPPTAPMAGIAPAITFSETTTPNRAAMVVTMRIRSCALGAAAPDYSRNSPDPDMVGAPDARAGGRVVGKEEDKGDRWGRGERGHKGGEPGRWEGAGGLGERMVTEGNNRDGGNLWSQKIGAFP